MICLIPTKIFLTRCGVHLAVREHFCSHVQNESGQGIEGERELCALTSFRTISVTSRGVRMWPFTKQNVCLSFISSYNVSKLNKNIKQHLIPNDSNTTANNAHKIPRSAFFLLRNILYHWGNSIMFMSRSFFKVYIRLLHIIKHLWKVFVPNHYMYINVTSKFFKRKQKEHINVIVRKLKWHRLRDKSTSWCYSPTELKWNYTAVIRLIIFPITLVYRFHIDNWCWGTI